MRRPLRYCCHIRPCPITTTTMNMDIDDLLAEVSVDSTPQESRDLQELTRCWVAERVAPEILPWPKELMDRVLARIARQIELVEEQTGNMDPKTNFRLIIIQTELERFKFLVRSFLRARIKKVNPLHIHLHAYRIVLFELLPSVVDMPNLIQIDTHPLHIQTLHNNSLDTPTSLLSPAEFQYLQSHQALLSAHYNTSFLSQFPATLQRLDDTTGGINMVTKPDEDEAVFVRALRDVGEIFVEGTDRRFEMKRGDVWVRPNMDDAEFDTQTDLSTQSILLAAAHHDISALRNLLRNSSANVQDSETGFTPLHAAIAACEPDDEENAKKQTNSKTNGDATEATEEQKQEVEAAVKTVKFLFENGAIWNDLDTNGDTPGCIAHRLGLKELYELCNPNYLASKLTFDRDRLLDDSSNGVMMEWETTLMRRSAELLAPTEGLRVLNVGHGMGIIDGILQEKKAKSHHIIEAHPDVIKRMKEQGWDKKPGVVIHEGRWQDIVPALVEKGELFDAIYFDTFAEEYKALREFFTEHVIGLLDPAGGSDGQGGKFGFFNGMGADRQIVYDVYNKIVEFDLFEAGFDTEWETVPVPDLDDKGEWEGVRRKYWVLNEYKLPTCSFIG
ncbi:arginine N-methyltransferase 2 [Pyrenophora seminiperda CCB06]|uniref:Arginine N-methyltransferase 2 n=1 Tax=Pyrenophora seminiperda CCB06 TaxID=1302712 RepID=A0A3M7MCB9_9PLEO|nr:arginine N-methyltransferase 2 [Pyrenophora seminiperda CCB06]